MRSPASASDFPLFSSTVDASSLPKGHPTPASVVPISVERTTGELLTGVKEKSEEALTVLFRRYWRLVFSIGNRVLGNPSEAEDLVQDVFLYLWSRGSLFTEGKGSGHEWLLRVIYSRAIEKRRKLMVRKYYDCFSSENQSKCKHTDITPALALGEKELVEQIDQDSVLEFLESAFDELSENQRRTIRLFLFEGHSLSEISTMYGESVGSTRNHYYRGIGRLRRLLGENQTADNND
jgi:RNA polymerase sigma-70 factor (ECF subfamily)